MRNSNFQKLFAFSFLMLMEIIKLYAQNTNVNPFQTDYSTPGVIEGMKLIWNDEFNYSGNPDGENWGYEYGFVRNRELQWYKPENAVCMDGRLVIQGKQDDIVNIYYNPNGSDWRSTDEFARYSSSSVISKGMKQWGPKGYFELRARIDTAEGSWPAIYMLGTNNDWPFCGEIDIMELYRIKNKPKIIANTAWGGEKKHEVKWSSTIKDLDYFIQKDPKWPEKYHVWSMEWNYETINIYIDNDLIHTTLLDSTININGNNPFRGDNEFYLLINQAIGSNGGKPDHSKMPFIFEIDYVRVYKPL